MNAHIQTGSLLTDHFRCPDTFASGAFASSDAFASFSVAGGQSARSGFFQFGPGVVCFGQCAGVLPASSPAAPLPDLLPHAAVSSSTVLLPFDPVQVVANLRHERYVNPVAPSRAANRMNRLVRKLYYIARPLMPVSVRKHLQRRYLRGWQSIPFPVWPVDSSVDTLHERLLALSMQARGVTRLPFIWFWPEGAPSCTAVTHDVETAAGLDFCAQLMDLNDSYGIKSSFQIVPEQRYPISPEKLEAIRARGFEINVHDLNHDGNLLSSHDEFLRRAQVINRHGRNFAARGFRAAVLYRNIDWYRELEFSYDMSVPTVGHLDPQRGGCCTVFPFFNGNLLELPVTMAQDYALYHMLNDYSIDIWKQQIALILSKHGLMKVIVHPDYNLDEKPRRVYAELLAYLAGLRAGGETWIALPAEIDRWWRQRHAMRLVGEAGSWRIEGEGSQHARLAWAVLDNGELRYEIASSASIN